MTYSRDECSIWFVDVLLCEITCRDLRFLMCDYFWQMQFLWTIVVDVFANIYIYILFWMWRYLLKIVYFGPFLLMCYLKMYCWDRSFWGICANLFCWCIWMCATAPSCVLAHVRHDSFEHAKLLYMLLHMYDMTSPNMWHFSDYVFMHLDSTEWHSMHLRL